MSYATNIAAITRVKVTLVIITLDYCKIAFGVSPCEATGTECYNTFHTCGDTTNFDKGSKSYYFINKNAAITTLISSGVDLETRPYVKDVSYLPTELKDDRTIPQRVTVQLQDEPDADLGIDPYWSERSYANATSVLGTFFKKLIARNPNYKNRIITIKEGFEGLSADDFVTKFNGKIEEISYDNNGVSIKAVDLIKGLDEVEYPFKSNSWITTAMGNYFKVINETDLVTLQAKKDDIAQVSIMDRFFITELTLTYASGGLLDGTYYYVVVVATTGYKYLAVTPVESIRCDYNNNAAHLEWEDVGADKYLVFRSGYTSNGWEVGYFDLETATEWTDTGIDAITPAPTTGNYDAEKYFKLTDYDPTVALDWDATESLPLITLNDASTLPTSGYIQIGKEIISYSGKAGNNLTGVKRALFDSKAEAHLLNTAVFRLVDESPQNPYVLAKKLLTDYAGYATSFIDEDAYGDYATAYDSIKMSIKPITKSTKLSNIYFDLMNVIDCKSWQNEVGQITILNTADTPVIADQLDDDNIIYNSCASSYNEKDRYTRISLAWFRTNLLEDLKNTDTYKRITISASADTEGPNDMNAEVLLQTYTSFINEDCDEETVLATYVDALLLAKLTRIIKHKQIFECELELKDSGLKVGDYVGLTTNEFQNTDGSGFTEVTFQITYKDVVNENKFKIKLEKV